MRRDNRFFFSTENEFSTRNRTSTRTKYYNIIFYNIIKRRFETRHGKVLTGISRHETPTVIYKRFLRSRQKQQYVSTKHLLEFSDKKKKKKTKYV